MHLNQFEPSSVSYFRWAPLEGSTRLRHFETQSPLVVLNYEYSYYSIFRPPDRDPRGMETVRIGDKDATQTEHFYPFSIRKLKAKGRLSP